MYFELLFAQEHHFVGHKEKYEILTDPGPLLRKECSNALNFITDFFCITAFNFALIWFCTMSCLGMWEGSRTHTGCSLECEVSLQGCIKYNLTKTAESAIATCGE